MKTPFTALFVSWLFIGAVRSENVYILHDSAVPQAVYAATKLRAALSDQKHEVMSERAKYDMLISLAVNESRLGAEAFQIFLKGRSSRSSAAICAA